MGDIQPINPADLLVDEMNPRLQQPNAGQNKAQEALARVLGKKLVVLAKDIVSHGLNPTDLPIVMPQPGNSTRHIVLEGNRRLVALRALETPDVFSGALDPKTLKQLRQASKEYLANPIDEALCFVVAERDEARHWIELRHTGENGGAGVLTWGSDESSRFKDRGGRLPVQALNFLQHSGALDDETRRKVPSTTLERLLDTPEVRSRLGLELRSGELHMLGNPQRVARALRHVVEDLVSKRWKVSALYTAAQRKDYAKKLPSSVAVPHTHPSGGGAPLQAGGAGAAKSSKSGILVTTGRKRDRLIPRDCVLNITAQRLKDIERELRKLSLEKHTNAVSVLFRVFIELSADHYHQEHATGVHENVSLDRKMEGAMNDLTAKGKLTAQQAKPVKTAIQRESFLAPSVLMLHQYIHNRHISPAPGDLRAYWDSLQPFVTALWAV